MELVLNDNRFIDRNVEFNLHSYQQFLGGKLDWYIVEVKKYNFDSIKKLGTKAARKPRVSVHKVMMLGRSSPKRKHQEANKKIILNKQGQNILSTYKSKDATTRAILNLTEQIRTKKDLKSTAKIALSFIISTALIIAIKLYDLYTFIYDGKVSLKQLSDYQLVPYNFEN